MSDIIYEITQKALNCKKDEIQIIKRLLGGKSNKTFLIKVNDTKYTFRIPGKNSSKFVDRFIEEKNLKIAYDLELSNEVVFLDTEDGYMISKYVEGFDLTEIKIDYEDVALLLKRLHKSKAKSKNNYNAFKRLEHYEQLNIDLNYKLDDEYYSLKDELVIHKKFLNKFKKVFCHNDSQQANIVKSDEKLYLLDWEFAGNNDFMYDIACFGNVSIDCATKLLNEYIESPSNKDYKRLYLWRSFQCLQWYNVATYKELIGLSIDLKVDFKMVAKNYLRKAKEMLSLSNKF